MTSRPIGRATAAILLCAMLVPRAARADEPVAGPATTQERRMRSPALFVTGLTLTIAGGAAAITGAAIAMANAGPIGGVSGGGSNSDGAIAVMGIGAAAVAIGLPCLVIGGKRETVSVAVAPASRGILLSGTF